jgi:hypothetical protein
MQSNNVLTTTQRVRKLSNARQKIKNTTRNTAIREQFFVFTFFFVPLCDDFKRRYLKLFCNNLFPSLVKIFKSPFPVLCVFGADIQITCEKKNERRLYYILKAPRA